MTPAEYDVKPAIEHLRLMVRNFDGCSETFNQHYSIDELVMLHRAWMFSGWDISPDRWSARQLNEALCGVAPRWDDNENPVYR